MDFSKAEKILEKALLRNAYGYTNIGDWWGLAFDNYWLVAQEIESPEEESLNKLLGKANPSILDGVDPENIAKSAIIQRNARKVVTNLELKSDGSLKLTFEGNRDIILSTSTKIVDWQWCLNRSGQYPYKDYIVACFKVGTIDIADH